MNETVQAALIIALLFVPAYIATHLTRTKKEPEPAKIPPASQEKVNIGLVHLNVYTPPCAACGHRLPIAHGSFIIQRWNEGEPPHQYHPECVILLCEGTEAPIKLDGTPFEGGDPPKHWEGWLVLTPKEWLDWVVDRHVPQRTTLLTKKKVEA
jgi:hypothetical protein